MNRTLYNQPINKDTTENCHPDKMNFEQFIENVQASVKDYHATCKVWHDGDYQYIEQWMELLMAYMEIELAHDDRG